MTTQISPNSTPRLPLPSHSPFHPHAPPDNQSRKSRPRKKRGRLKNEWQTWIMTNPSPPSPLRPLHEGLESSTSDSSLFLFKMAWCPSKLNSSAKVFGCWTSTLRQMPLQFLRIWPSRPRHLGQGSVNSSLWAPSGLPPIFANKVLLEHTHLYTVTIPSTAAFGCHGQR